MNMSGLYIQRERERAVQRCLDRQIHMYSYIARDRQIEEHIIFDNFSEHFLDVKKI